MSDLGLDLDHPREHRKKHRSRNGLGCLAVLVALTVLAGGAFFLYDRGVAALQDRFSPPEDYSGSGTGSVVIEVAEGDAASDIAGTLVAEDVVKSAEAFVDEASANPESVGIQVGFYEMKKQMSSEAALDRLLDPANMVQSAVTVPEGYTVEQVLSTLAKDTDFSKKEFEAVLRRPAAIGLPAYAGGNAEGYLFPATYMLPPNATPKSILTMMVDRWQQAAEDAGLEAAAQRLGYTPAELMVVASLVEAESNRDDDRGKVARVIYNRLETDATNGLLQIDAAVNYAHDRDLGVALTTEDLEIDSPYNTYKNAGLPPTPIEAPGDAAIEAAANPTDGPWVYYVTVNLRTGETKFTDSYDEFLRFKEEYKQYCATQSDNC